VQQSAEDNEAEAAPEDRGVAEALIARRAEALLDEEREERE